MTWKRNAKAQEDRIKREEHIAELTAEFVDDLDFYDADVTECAKCGGAQATLKHYTSVKVSITEHVKDDDGTRSVRHDIHVQNAFRRECTTCGFVWLEKPLDHGDKES